MCKMRRAKPAKPKRSRRRKLPSQPRSLNTTRKPRAFKTFLSILGESCMNTSHPYSPQKAAYDKAWRDNHKSERRIYKEKWTRRWRATFKGRYDILRSRARWQELAMDISFDQFVGLTPFPCYYCGGDRSDTWGLDRVDSALGYVMENVRPCCRRCNLAKNNMTELEFRTWATALAKHWL